MIKVEFTKTTFDTVSKCSYRAGMIVDVEEEFAANCEKLGAIKYVNSNVTEVAKELVKEVEAAKEEEHKKQDELEEVVEQALIEQEEMFKLTEYVKGLKLTELKEFAKNNNVNLKGKTKKADILAVILEEIHRG